MKKGFVVFISAIMLISLVAGCGAGPANVSPSGSHASANQSTSAAGTEKAVWPTGNTINVDVPAKAGGGTDLIVRYLTTPWGQSIGKNFVVTNYDTAEVGTQHLAKADPDGMTLSLAACTTMDNYLSGFSEVSPVKDMTCIAKITAGGPQVLFTNVNAPYNNLKELKEYAEANPGDVTVGCTLGGTSQLMWLNVVKAMGNIELNYVQCPSESDKLSNVAAGSINLGNGSLNNAIAYEADGKIKILGILSNSEELGKNDHDSSLGDQYLTTWEQGFKDSSWEAGFYLVGPAGMDPEVVKQINESVKVATTDSSFIKGMQSMSNMIDHKNVEESQADFLKEWEIQVALTTAAGVNIRK